MKEIRLNIKPLSVNECWQGKRFKTPLYKKYEQNMLLMLPKFKIDIESKLAIDLEFGFSSPLCDLDNPVKPLIDILQKKYGFNDKNIVKLNLTKVLVKKGLEYISIKIIDIYK